MDILTSNNVDLTREVLKADIAALDTTVSNTLNGSFFHNVSLTAAENITAATPGKPVALTANGLVDFSKTIPKVQDLAFGTEKASQAMHYDPSNGRLVILTTKTNQFLLSVYTVALDGTLGSPTTTTIAVTRGNLNAKVIIYKLNTADKYLIAYQMSNNASDMNMRILDTSSGITLGTAIDLAYVPSGSPDYIVDIMHDEVTDVIYTARYRSVGSRINAYTYSGNTITEDYLSTTNLSNLQNLLEVYAYNDRIYGFEDDNVRIFTKSGSNWVEGTPVSYPTNVDYAQGKEYGITRKPGTDKFLVVDTQSNPTVYMACFVGATGTFSSEVSTTVDSNDSSDALVAISADPDSYAFTLTYYEVDTQSFSQKNVVVNSSTGAIESVTDFQGTTIIGDYDLAQIGFGRERSFYIDGVCSFPAYNEDDTTWQLLSLGLPVKSIPIGTIKTTVAAASETLVDLAPEYIGSNILTGLSGLTRLENYYFGAEGFSTSPDDGAYIGIALDDDKLLIRKSLDLQKQEYLVYREINASFQMGPTSTAPNTVTTIALTNKIKGTSMYIDGLEFFRTGTYDVVFSKVIINIDNKEIVLDYERLTEFDYTNYGTQYGIKLPLRTTVNTQSDGSYGLLPKSRGKLVFKNNLTIKVVGACNNAGVSSGFSAAYNVGVIYNV